MLTDAQPSSIMILDETIPIAAGPKPQKPGLKNPREGHMKWRGNSDSWKPEYQVEIAGANWRENSNFRDAKRA
jgi:hypothetical protein